MANHRDAKSKIGIRPCRSSIAKAKGSLAGIGSRPSKPQASINLFGKQNPVGRETRPMFQVL
jgi:hypothetical protein